MASNVRAPAVQAQQSARPDAPDAGGFKRLRGWCVCVPPQEWAQRGQWVIDGAMAALQPKRWHTWGIWPATDVAGRVPGVFSDQYFDRAATRRYLADYPAREWKLFNEPEVASQANMTPAQAVDVTLEFIDLARSVGNEFQWMAPSVTINTSHDWLGWLTEYMLIMRRRKGIMRPCAWGIHPYNCATVADLRQSMRKWWDWYAVWGSGALTVITEVCAEGAGVAGQMLVMNECAAMLQRKEVAGMAWASAYLASADGVPWEYYPLCTLDIESKTVALTDLGRHWKALQ